MMNSESRMMVLQAGEAGRWDRKGTERCPLLLRPQVYGCLLHYHKQINKQVRGALACPKDTSMHELQSMTNTVLCTRGILRKNKN